MLDRIAGVLVVLVLFALVALVAWRLRRKVDEAGGDDDEHSPWRFP